MIGICVIGICVIGICVIGICVCHSRVMVASGILPWVEADRCTHLALAVRRDWTIRRAPGADKL